MSVIRLYRIARWLHAARVPIVPKLIDYLGRLIFACWVPHSAMIGRRTVLGYGGLGVVIHSASVIGDDVHIDQHVTIGGTATRTGTPRIGNRVYIGAGAKVLGPIIIGDGSIIGANAVVLHDVPPRSVVVGVPARIVKQDIDFDTHLAHLAGHRGRDVGRAP